MIAIDYHQILNSQFQESKQGYKRVFSWYTVVKSFFSTRWLIKKINTKLTDHLISIKGVNAYLLEHISDFKDKNLRTEITTIEKAIQDFYSFEADLERQLSNPKFKELSTAHSITREILDVMYDILRLLKKNSLKTPMPVASEEARIAIGHSRNTLNKIIDGR